MMEVLIQLREFDLKVGQESGVCILGGWSVGEESIIRYDKLIQFIVDYLNKNERIIIYFRLDLFDMTSLSKIFKIIQILNEFHRKGKKVFVKW